MDHFWSMKPLILNKDFQTMRINSLYVLNIEHLDKCIVFKTVDDKTIKFCESDNKDAYKAILKNLFNNNNIND